MGEKRFLRFAISVFLILLIVVYFALDGYTKEGKPNIIIILADDLGYVDLSCYGQLNVLTKYIDHLAFKGMFFTQFYAGSPIDAPSRCVLLTGKHTGHANIRGNLQVEPSGQLPLSGEEITFAKLLHNNGYKTGYFGKWGLGLSGTSGDPQKHGFEEFVGYYDLIRSHNSYPEYIYKNGRKIFLKNKVYYLSDNQQIKGLSGYAIERNEYSNDIILESALEFIEKNHKKPFFLLFAPTIPHCNNEAPNGMQYEVPDFGIYEYKKWTNEQKAYAALLTRLDSYVGKLLEKLRELNIYDNTVIIFTSDNGAVNNDEILTRFKSNGIFRGGKGELFEGGIRVPLIIFWPEKNPKMGGVSEIISSFQDIFPTICDIAGIDYDSGKIDGISLLPTFLYKKDLQHKHSYLYWELYEGKKPIGRAVRMGKWKAIQDGQDGHISLYNLENDPKEKFDLSSRNIDIIDKIKNILKEAHTSTDLWNFKTK